MPRHTLAERRQRRRDRLAARGQIAPQPQLPRVAARAIQIRPKNLVDLNNSNSVAAGQTAIWELAMGPTFEHIFIKHDASVTLAEMEGIRLRVNGEVVIEFASGTDLNIYNIHQGYPTDAGTWLTLSLARVDLLTQIARELTGLATGNGDPRQNPNVVTSAFLEIDIAAGAASPVVSAQAEISGPRGPSDILKIRQKTLSPAGAGVFEFNNLSYQAGDFINQIFWLHSNLTDFEIKIDGKDYWKMSVADQALLHAQGVRVAQAAAAVFDPTFRGQGTQALPTAGIEDLRTRLTVSGADTIVEYVVSIGKLVA